MTECLDTSKFVHNLCLSIYLALTRHCINRFLYSRELSFFHTGTRYFKKRHYIEENKQLLDYLSNCKFDEANHVLHLPDPDEHKIPDDFKCTFRRRTKEKIFEATFEEESFNVIILDEKDWDSEKAGEEDQDQVFFWTCSGYHMRGVVVSYLSFEGRYQACHK